MSDVDAVEDFLGKNFQKPYGIKLIREYITVKDVLTLQREHG